MKYKVLDTNILLLDAHNLTTMGKDGSTIVLPETVLDEVDSKKSVLGEIGFQARSLGRMLNTAVRIDTVVDNTGATTYIELDGVSIVVVSLKQYSIDFTTDYNILNDRKIITVAKLWYDKHPETVFVSNDVMCRIRAESMGVPVADHKQVETVDISFTRELLVVDDEAFRTAHHTAVLELDPDYKPNYFNYVLTSPNTDQTKLAIVVDGKLQVIGRETETDLRKQDISPGNAAQLFFSRALQDPMIDICICESKAGSGL